MSFDKSILLNIIFMLILDGASNHALQAFCDSLRNENGKNNIDVLVVSPSYVNTGLGQSTLSGSGEKLGGELVAKVFLVKSTAITSTLYLN